MSQARHANALIKGNSTGSCIKSFPYGCVQTCEYAFDKEGDINWENSSLWLAMPLVIGISGEWKIMNVFKKPGYISRYPLNNFCLTERGFSIQIQQWFILHYLNTLGTFQKENSSSGHKTLLIQVGLGSLSFTCYQGIRISGRAEPTSTAGSLDSNNSLHYPAVLICGCVSLLLCIVKVFIFQNSVDKRCHSRSITWRAAAQLNRCTNAWLCKGQRLRITRCSIYHHTHYAFK